MRLLINTWDSLITFTQNASIKTFVRFMTQVSLKFYFPLTSHS